MFGHIPFTIIYYIAIAVPSESLQLFILTCTFYKSVYIMLYHTSANYFTCELALSKRGRNKTNVLEQKGETCIYYVDEDLF